MSSATFMARRDLFDALIEAIEADDARRGDAVKTTAVLLGDLIDRGADSAGVIRVAREWGARRQVRYFGKSRGNVPRKLR